LISNQIFVGLQYICHQRNAQIYHKTKTKVKAKTTQSRYFIIFSFFIFRFKYKTIKNQNIAQYKEKL
jgi:hypothetical protein